jgi:hypothetical protein
MLTELSDLHLLILCLLLALLVMAGIDWLVPRR